MESKPSPKSSRWKVVALIALVGLVSVVLIGMTFIEPPGIIRVDDNDWPWWRGPNGSGVTNSAAPIHWSQTENVVWKADIPGRGHGSPILHGERVYFASADEQEKALSLFALDRRNGEPLWQCELQRGGMMHKSIKNTYASASAACDGERVFYPWIAGDAIWLAAVSLDGEILWKQQVAPFTSEHGYASSPCLYRSLVIVASDNPGPSFVTALNRKTGKVVWQVSRSTGGSYGTPVVAHLAGRDQLLLSGQNSVVSYDPATGHVWWKCEGPGESTIGTVAWRDQLAYATCGAPPMIAGVMAIDADSGRIAWRADAMANVPSPLVVGDRLLVTEDRGTIVCFSAESGEQLWKERLGGNFSASPVLAGDLVYLPNEAGTIFVFRADDKFELVAEVDLGEDIFASPVISDGRLYLRTIQHLYCIGD